MRTHAVLPQILLACALAAGVAACGGSSTSSKPSASAKASGGGAASTEKTIAANWTAFFSAQTPEAKRVSLLQDGQVFAPVLKAQSGSGLASSASAKVTKVTLVSSTQAKVTYSILVAGASVLPNQTGTAVNQGGTWKVGVASFCGLLTLENNGNTAKLPAACKSAG